MVKWTGSGRTRVRGDSAASHPRLSDYISQMRKVAGEIANQVKVGGIWSGTHTIRIADDAVVQVNVLNNIPGVEPIVNMELLLTPKPSARRTPEEEVSSEAELLLVAFVVSDPSGDGYQLVYKAGDGYRSESLSTIEGGGNLSWSRGVEETGRRGSANPSREVITWSGPESRYFGACDSPNIWRGGELWAVVPEGVVCGAGIRHEDTTDYLVAVVAVEGTLRLYRARVAVRGVDDWQLLSQAEFVAEPLFIYGYSPPVFFNEDATKAVGAAFRTGYTRNFGTSPTSALKGTNYIIRVDANSLSVEEQESIAMPERMGAINFGMNVANEPNTYEMPYRTSDVLDAYPPQELRASCGADYYNGEEVVAYIDYAEAVRNTVQADVFLGLTVGQHADHHTSNWSFSTPPFLVTKLVALQGEEELFSYQLCAFSTFSTGNTHRYLSGDPRLPDPLGAWSIGDSIRDVDIATELSGEFTNKIHYLNLRTGELAATKAKDFRTTYHAERSGTADFFFFQNHGEYGWMWPSSRTWEYNEVFEYFKEWQLADDVLLATRFIDKPNQESVHGGIAGARAFRTLGLGLLPYAASARLSIDVTYSSSSPPSTTITYEDTGANKHYDDMDTLKIFMHYPSTEAQEGVAHSNASGIQPYMFIYGPPFSFNTMMNEGNVFPWGEFAAFVHNPVSGHDLSANSLLSASIKAAHIEDESLLSASFKRMEMTGVSNLYDFFHGIEKPEGEGEWQLASAGMSSFSAVGTQSLQDHLGFPAGYDPEQVFPVLLRQEIKP